MKVTAIERVSASWPAGAQERYNAPQQRLAHLVSPTTDTEAPSVDVGARHVPVLPVGNDHALRPTTDVTVAYVQQHGASASREAAATGLLAPLPAGADPTTALNQAYGSATGKAGAPSPTDPRAQGTAAGAAQGAPTPPDGITAADDALALNAPAQPAPKPAPEPPKEPISKQLMELVSSMWAASRAAVDAITPPEADAARQATAQAAQGPTHGFLPFGADRRLGGGAGPGENPSTQPLGKAYNTRSRIPAVQQKA